MLIMEGQTEKSSRIFYIMHFVDVTNKNKKSYDDSAKLKRTEMDPFRLG